MTSREIALFQLGCSFMCMPFDVFHMAVRQSLGRPISDLEMALKPAELIKEILEKDIRRK